MQRQLQQNTLFASSPVRQSSNAELWRGTWVIFTKHMHKFLRNGQEVGGTLAAPILLAATFGLGMEKVVAADAIAGLNYLSFIAPGIIAFTALSGAINAGMPLLEEKIKGVMKEYMVAPIPRLSILLAATASGLVKTFVQSTLIVLVTVLFGARLQMSPGSALGATLVLTAFMVTMVGFANAMALRSRSIGGYHTILFLLNLPLLFFSSALYPLDAMPVWMRAVAVINPTTYAVEGMRRWLFGGDALHPLLCLAVLTVTAVLSLWFSVRTFQRVME
ncbi:MULTISPECIES: ABC transporter permease [Caldilinea]|jgi:ABC-2 type transport system permease protein|nr:MULTISPECIES: ABC transporter permease [Caldilinea]MBO9393269.1 ABC transporter permease [Caldilinea sp.]GIV73334.1 MAG: transport permease protein [Caldilinea sp.]